MKPIIKTLKTINPSDWLAVREVQLDNRWAVCFRRPEPNQLVDGLLPHEPLQYWWLDVDLYHLNGDHWEWSFSGSIKHDGCSNWNQFATCWHLCGPLDATLLSIVYDEAAELLNSEDLDEMMSAAAKGERPQEDE